MKTIASNDNLNVYIYKSEIKTNLFDKEKLEQYIKKIILKLKKRYLQNISGFYRAKVYYNEKYGIIIDIIKEDELDFFPDLLDFKVVVDYKSTIYLSFEDYFLIKNKNIYHYNKNYYIDINNLNEEEIVKLSEFSKIIYGEKLEQIKNKLKLVK